MSTPIHGLRAYPTHLVSRFRINGPQAGPEAFDPDALDAQVDEVIAQTAAEREQRQQEAKRQCEERRKRREALRP